MPRTSSEIAFPRLPRLCQLSMDHCGPAVISQLCSFAGVKFTQAQVVVTANAQKKLKTHGMTIFDMAKAIRKHTLGVKMWHKINATYKDIATLVSHYKLPVGVEWQGDFGKFGDGDNGHYSVITGINIINQTLSLADPYEKFAGRDRVFTLKKFRKRWWDENEIQLFYGKKTIRDRRLLFIIAPKNNRFPKVTKLLPTPDSYAR